MDRFGHARTQIGHRWPADPGPRQGGEGDDHGDRHCCLAKVLIPSRCALVATAPAVICCQLQRGRLDKRVPPAQITAVDGGVGEEVMHVRCFFATRCATRAHCHTDHAPVARVAAHPRDKESSADPASHLVAKSTRARKPTRIPSEVLPLVASPARVRGEDEDE
eukprot:CAMPEP_0174743228 /NCGR_PEP_ID=MMETSP1094-20130205/81058_1 /TAXON_ID=156173 /ORGANISM="Chrysochromulina brevifilum, Strain UTEX LB 985" /LENGTH=163 /DNA_ID=CAMNT_0015947411 /DNA_START=229 /DNA_END=717 /DNA_ORIENTATION=-